MGKIFGNLTLISFLLSGCVTPNHRITLDSWVGKTEQDLFLSWGLPDKEIKTSVTNQRLFAYQTCKKKRDSSWIGAALAGIGDAFFASAGQQTNHAQEVMDRSPDEGFECSNWVFATENGIVIQAVHKDGAGNITYDTETEEKHNALKPKEDVGDSDRGASRGSGGWIEDR